MNVKEVIEELQKLPQELPVFVHDGMDPSDRVEVDAVELGSNPSFVATDIPVVFISS